MVARGAPGDWAGACARAAAGGCVLKDHAGGTVWRATVLGRECVLKCVPVRGPRRRIQSLLRISPAWRHWRNACWLRGRGIAAGEPLAIVEGRSGAASVECLVVGYVSGATVLAHAAGRDLPPRAEHRVAEAIAMVACRLAREGRKNRDPKPSNLVVMRAGERAAELAVIDCADLRRCARENDAAIVRALAAAVLEPMGCGCAPRLALRARAVREAAGRLEPADVRAAFRRLWRRIEAVVEAHGDPTPRDDPLA